MNSSALASPKATEPRPPLGPEPTSAPGQQTGPGFQTGPGYSAESGVAIHNQKMDSAWWLFNVLLPLGILAVGGLAIALFGKQAVPTKPPIDQSLAARIERLPEVKTLPARSLDLVGGYLNLVVDGEVVPHRELQIATEVAGQIVYQASNCEVGSFVNQGDLLFRIDPTDYQNEVERLTKLKTQEYQAIRELEQEELNANRLIEVATRDVELRDRDIDRLRALPSGVASGAELDQAQRLRLQAVNTRVTLENQVDLLRQRRARLEAAEQLAATQLAMAETNLKRTEIRAPHSGVIFRRDAEVNSFVQRGQVIIRIEDTSKAEIVVNLRTDQLYWVLDQARANASSGVMRDTDLTASDTPEIAQDYLLPSTSATIEYSLAGRENEVLRWQGTLARYDGIGFDATSRTVPVRVVVDNPRRARISEHGEERALATGPTALVRGMFVSVVLHVQPRKPLVIVPAVALKPGESGNRLWKFAPDLSVIDEKNIVQPPVTMQLPAATDQKENPAELEGDKLESNESERPEFDISKWDVGRVEVLNRVRPIVSVLLPEAEQEDGRIAKGGSDKANYWICEVGDGQLKPGERLIVSPLPSFEGKGRDGVRTPIQAVQSL